MGLNLFVFSVGTNYLDRTSGIICIEWGPIDHSFFHGGMYVEKL